MEESNDLPLKRVELSLTKFNEVAVPHHLNLLRQHKANIIKHCEAGEARLARAEQTNAGRVARQLRALLAEMEALRRRLRPCDRPAFDASTQRARRLTLLAITDYLDTIESNYRKVAASRSHAETCPVEMQRRSPDDGVASSAASTDSVGLVRTPAGPEPEPEPRLLHLQLHELAEARDEREETARGWAELQAEVSALHDTWRALHHAAHAQHEQVEAAEGAVEVAAHNVAEARQHLSLAERARGGWWAGAGAAAGLAAGGPVGLLAGLKAGAAAAAAAALLAATAASLLHARRDKRGEDNKRD